jgi:hypothetical protein
MNKLCIIASLISTLPLCGMEQNGQIVTSQQSLNESDAFNNNLFAGIHPDVTRVVGEQLFKANPTGTAMGNFSALPNNIKAEASSKIELWTKRFPRTTEADYFERMHNKQDFLKLSETMETAYKASLPYYNSEIIPSERWKHLKMFNEQVGYKLLSKGTPVEVQLSDSERRWKTFYEVRKITTELVPRRATLLAIGGFVLTGGFLATLAHKYNNPMLSMDNVTRALGVGACLGVTAIPYTFINEGYPIIERRHAESLEEKETRTL